MREPSSSTSASFVSTATRRASRALTSAVASSSCLVWVESDASEDAMASATRPGCVSCATASPISSGRSGESSAIRLKSVVALRARASASRSPGAGMMSGTSSTRARRNGWVCTISSRRMRVSPCTAMRTVPSCCLNTLWMEV